MLAVAAAFPILVHHLVRKPALTPVVKLRLALALGVLPAFAAATSTTAGLHTTTEREFCGSCHVMQMHVLDAEDPASQSLAARHTKNPFFGERNCYVCHADYSMLGYPLTKLNGMRHVYSYYFHGYLNEPVERAVERIELYKPYDNTNCQQCHTGTGQLWQRVPEHRSLQRQLATNEVSCASEGCHGYAHPFSKQNRSLAAFD